MDWSSLETYLLLEKRWANATVDEQIRHLKRAQSQGLDLDNLTLASAKAHMVKKLREGASPAAYNNLVKALKACCAWKGLDSKELKLGKPQRSRYKYLSPEQVRACLNYRCYPKKREPFRRGLLLLLLKTGLRLGEVVSLTVADLDATTSPNRIYVGKPTKRGTKRWIPVEPWVLSPRRALGGLVAGRPPGSMLLAWNGAPATTEDIRRELQAISRELGFRVNCTITRHTRATELRRGGWDLLALKEYLGHANITSTAIYAAVNTEDLQHLMRTKGSRDPWTATSRWRQQ
jgi:site-specific recombinase XerD